MKGALPMNRIGIAVNCSVDRDGIIIPHLVYWDMAVDGRWSGCCIPAAAPTSPFQASVTPF